VLLNSPNNPTGAVYSPWDLKALAEVLLAHPHVLVLSDDIYERILYEGEFATLAQVEPRLLGRILTVNGVSKSYSMTGWRLGYAAGPAWLVGAIEKLQSQSTSNPSSISQAASVDALRGDQNFLYGWMMNLKHAGTKPCGFSTRHLSCDAGLRQARFTFSSIVLAQSDRRRPRVQ
jgi:aspartate aminotransferase